MCWGLVWYRLVRGIGLFAFFTVLCLYWLGFLRTFLVFSRDYLSVLVRRVIWFLWKWCFLVKRIWISMILCCLIFGRRWGSYFLFGWSVNGACLYLCNWVWVCVILCVFSYVIVGNVVGVFVVVWYCDIVIVWLWMWDYGWLCYREVVGDCDCVWDACVIVSSFVIRV